MDLGELTMSDKAVTTAVTSPKNPEGQAVTKGVPLKGEPQLVTVPVPVSWARSFSSSKGTSNGHTVGAGSVAVELELQWGHAGLCREAAGASGLRSIPVQGWSLLS